MKKAIYLSRPEAANRIGITPGTLATWASDPEKTAALPFYRAGGRVEYLESDVEAFIAARRIKVGGQP